MNKKQELIHSIALCFGVLVFTFAISYLVSAWTEPTSAPPGGNVETPINVSGSGQLKYGNLVLNWDNKDVNTEPGLRVYGEHIVYTDPCPSGYIADGESPHKYCIKTVLYSGTTTVGIGTANPQYTLDVNGDVNLQNSVLRLGGKTGTANQIPVSDANGKIAWKDASDIMTQITLGPKGYVLSSDGVSFKWVSPEEIYILMLPLVKGSHTGQQCIEAGGEIVDTDVGQKQCRFTIPYVKGNNIQCSSYGDGGWKQYRGASPTKDPVGNEYSGYSTCVGYIWPDPYGGSEDCGPHDKSWGNGAYSDHCCQFCAQYYYSDCPVYCSQHCGGPFYATRIQIGCY